MRTIVLIIVLQSIATNVKSQITPDSLIGVYFGECWFKYDEDSIWKISPSTYTVESADSNCFMNGYGCSHIKYSEYETGYNFCFGNSSNWFVRFYGGDSLKIVFDHISPPPPNYHPYSGRFYGKKYTTISINTPGLKVPKIKIYPNPSNNHVTIETQLTNLNIEIFDLNGRLVHSHNSLRRQSEINVSHLEKGLYILKIYYKDSMDLITKKLLIN